MTEIQTRPIPDNWITRQYGSKKGLIRYVKFEIFRIFGRYRKIKSFKQNKPKRFVFVCAGNICRSPLGEAVTKTLGVDSISIGLSTRGGDKADPRAIAFAEENGYSLADHRTTPIEDYVPRQGDMLILMEPNHIFKVKRACPEVPYTLLGLYLDRPKAYIHDPFNSSELYFKKCEQDVLRSSKTLATYAKS